MKIVTLLVLCVALLGCGQQRSGAPTQAEFDLLKAKNKWLLERRIKLQEEHDRILREISTLRRDETEVNEATQEEKFELSEDERRQLEATLGENFELSEEQWGIIEDAFHELRDRESALPTDPER